jgi:hypothetical protein
MPPPALSSGVTTSAPAAAVPIQNPRIIQDPMAGVITEYMNIASGQVISQAPSVIAVAYLRQGMSADGMSKQNPAPVVKTA